MKIETRPKPTEQALNKAFFDLAGEKLEDKDLIVPVKNTGEARRNLDLSFLDNQINTNDIQLN